MATHPVRMSQISRVQCDYFIRNHDILECKRNARTSYTKHLGSSGVIWGHLGHLGSSGALEGFWKQLLQYLSA